MCRERVTALDRIAFIDWRGKRHPHCNWRDSDCPCQCLLGFRRNELADRGSGHTCIGGLGRIVIYLQLSMRQLGIDSSGAISRQLPALFVVEVSNSFTIGCPHTVASSPPKGARPRHASVRGRAIRGRFPPTNGRGFATAGSAQARAPASPCSRTGSRRGSPRSSRDATLTIDRLPASEPARLAPPPTEKRER